MTTLAEIAKAGQAQAHTPEWKRKAILATNAVGVVAAPAAVGAAIRGARSNSGGVPRELGTATANRLRASGYKAVSRSGGTRGSKRLATGRAIQKPISTLNRKIGRKGRIGAALAGGSMIALQAAQSSGDFLAAQENSKKRTPSTSVDKRVALRGTFRGKTLKDFAPKTATQAATAVAVPSAAGTGYFVGSAKKRERKRRQQAWEDYMYGKRDTSLAELSKAVRPYDPEDIRQRNSGIAPGIALGGATYAGAVAGRNLSSAARDLRGRDARLSVDVGRMPGRGRKGRAPSLTAMKTPPGGGERFADVAASRKIVRGGKAGLAAGALALAGGGLAYRAGNRKNRRWK